MAITDLEMLVLADIVYERFTKENVKPKWHNKICTGVINNAQI